MQPKLSEPIPKELEEFLLEAPGLTSFYTDDMKIGLQGLVHFSKQWYRLKLVLPNFPKIKDFKMMVLKDQEYVKFTEENVTVDMDLTVWELIMKIPEFFESICTIVEPDNNPSQVIKDETTSGNIYSEIAELYAPQSYQIELNENYSRIRFSKFANYENHYLELDLPSLNVREHSLPDGFPWMEVLKQKCFTLTGFIEQFLKYLQDLQYFYENLCMIDELCHVVQPANPSTKDNWRLFVLHKNVYLKVTISDPLAPIASLSVQIIGPTYEVEKLRRTYSEGLANWDFELDIHKNLLRIFDLCFFPMPDNNKSEEEEYCNICYSYKFEGDVPIISCDNPKCDLIFHPSCLKQWFSTLTDGKLFLDVSLGTCPHCKENLSASFVEILEK